jgi:hypothetical protein
MPLFLSAVGVLIYARPLSLLVYGRVALKRVLILFTTFVGSEVHVRCLSWVHLVLHHFY